MRDHFLKLFVYNDWANKRICESVQRFGNVDTHSLAILNHIVQVQKLWLDRTQGIQTTNHLWDPAPIPEILELSDYSTREWRQLIDITPASGWGRRIGYVNIRGVAFTNTLEEIVTQVINHGTHHRAQVSMMIRQAGHQPPVLDFISFARNE